MSGTKTHRHPWLAPRGEHGVALLEVLIAGAILAIAVAGLSLMLSSGQSLVMTGGDERAALYLAQQKIEQLRGLGLRCIPVGPSADAVGPEPGCQSSTQQDYNETPADLGSSRYSRLTVVECVDPQTFTPTAPCPDPVTAKRITVTVAPQMHEADSITISSVLTLH